MILVITTLESIACVVPTRGTKWNAEKLIDEAKLIVLVKVVSPSEHEIVEVLKENPEEYPQFPRITGFMGSDTPHESHHYSNDFNNHEDINFWVFDVGRSDWPCCPCSPLHTFIPGEMYLLFPDAYGARKSAEIIRNLNDKWYQFVKLRVLNKSVDKIQFLDSSNTVNNTNLLGKWLDNWERTYQGFSPEKQSEINQNCQKKYNLDCKDLKNTIEFFSDKYVAKVFDKNNILIDSSEFAYTTRKINTYKIIYNEDGTPFMVVDFENEDKLMLIFNDGTKSYFTKINHSHNKSLKHGTAQSAAP